MGNQIFCCRYEILNTRTQGYESLHEDTVVTYQPGPSKEFSKNSLRIVGLQHISDREDLYESSEEINPIFSFNLKHIGTQPVKIPNRRRNSCHSSALFNLGPIFKPESRTIVRSCAMAVASNISRDTSSKDLINSPLYGPFVERDFELIHVVKAAANLDASEPEGLGECAEDCLLRRHFHEVHDFLHRIFAHSLVGPQCAIAGLVFFERILRLNEGMQVYEFSWRKQLLACVILACKILDDQAVWNVDFCQMLNNMPVDVLNELEHDTLQYLAFNINIDQQQYALYFFHLQALDWRFFPKMQPEQSIRLDCSALDKGLFGLSHRINALRLRRSHSCAPSVTWPSSSPSHFEEEGFCSIDSSVNDTTPLSLFQEEEDATVPLDEFEDDYAFLLGGVEKASAKKPVSRGPRSRMADGSDSVFDSGFF